MRSLLVMALLPLAACAPPCGQVCRKVLACGIDSERVAQSECENSCNRQGQLYNDWDDEELIELFEEQRRCISRSSCDELAAGACYEGYEALYVFDTDKELPPVSEPETPVP
jgi:hypothetical protein